MHDNVPMLRHEDIWNAIDRLAHDRGLTASGLARRAGLDPTTFNKSKRITREGKPRWPSTESIAKVLDATGASLSEFLGFLTKEPGVDQQRTLLLVSSLDASAADHLDPVVAPCTGDIDEITFPENGETHAYALEVADGMLEPPYREGDVLILSPTAQVRRGDRVLVRTTDGALFAAELSRRTARRLTYKPLSAGHARSVTLDTGQVSWQARILWASQ